VPPRISIWENGGGFFGVPLVNFLGWTFTVYLFMQVFAVYVRNRGPVATVTGLSTTDMLAVILYAATTLSFLSSYVRGERTTVTDAAGHTWHTGDIYESSILLAVYGMGFIAILALMCIAQRRTETADTPAVKANQPEPERVSA
jgi:hypothetical protein